LGEATGGTDLYRSWRKKFKTSMRWTGRAGVLVGRKDWYWSKRTKKPSRIKGFSIAEEESERARGGGGGSV